ncbi:hypothetical protein AEAC466_01450 [Asticcacaulis sp. AC466]|uniref:aspartyl protease family protein n=1 Tax=Asticcacaulis sp. AC466 TaxID=1282362 RepID=UPI0003C3BC3E|nr:aspartyl protease family protein [Asticcacaulis sp. AC466]ESQ85871.1 hypothetical protein AEAC466_01450 [Asticcacaulis sp. AC466]
MTSLFRHPSRRGLIGCTGAVAIAGALRASHAFPQTITAAPPPGTDADHDTANLAAGRDLANHLTIDVQINGQGPYHFVVDTGAERSVIADNVAMRLALPAGRPVTIDGISKRIEVPSSHIDSLSFGPFNRTGLDLPVLPRTSLFADGYLGLDVINGTRVTFDFQHRLMRIEQPKSKPNTPGRGVESTHIHTKGSDGRLRIIDCLVDNMSATAFIDTGAEVSVGNVALMTALKARNRQLGSRGTMTLTGVTGGEFTGDILPVKRIRLQDLTFTDGTLVIADVPDFSVWKLRQRPALLIGMDYLRQFSAVTIDYRSKEIRFDLSLAPPRLLPGVKIDRTA